MKFDCIKCGACCKSVENIKELPSVNGQCIHLGLDNSCKIYKTRPFVCRVDDIYDNHFKDDMTREQFHEWTRTGCVAVRKKLEERNKR